MDYLACNLPTHTAKVLKDYWSEYWARGTPEAQLAHQICAFEHLLALDEDRETGGDFYKPYISSPELKEWLELLDSSRKEMKELRNGASFGSAYWKDPNTNMLLPAYWEDPERNMALLDEVIKTKSATSPLAFIRMLRDMSNIIRRGWITRGMEQPISDSNASHSLFVGLIAFLFSKVRIAGYRSRYL